ncbi:MAG: hypothetical protein ACRDI3_03580 [Actinomycetota bacterium]
MSIETVLTLVVAAGLLATAALLRLAAIGIYRIYGRLWGRYGPAAEPTRGGRLDDALPGPSLHERADRVLQGAGALMIYAVASAARGLQILYEYLRIVVRAAWYLTVAAYAWLAPRAQTAYRTIRRDAIARRTPLPVRYLPDAFAIPAMAQARSHLDRRAGAA